MTKMDALLLKYTIYKQ